MSVFDKFFERYSYRFPKGYPDFTNNQDILILENIFNEMGLFEIGALGRDAIMKYPYRAELFAQKFTSKDSEEKKFTSSKTEEDVILDKIVIKGKEFTPKDDPKDIEKAIIDAEGIAKLYGSGINGLSFASIAKTKEFKWISKKFFYL